LTEITQIKRIPKAHFLFFHGKKQNLFLAFIKLPSNFCLYHSFSALLILAKTDSDNTLSRAIPEEKLTRRLRMDGDAWD